MRLRCRYGVRVGAVWRFVRSSVRCGRHQAERRKAVFVFGERASLVGVLMPPRDAEQILATTCSPSDGLLCCRQRGSLWRRKVSMMARFSKSPRLVGRPKTFGEMARKSAPERCSVLSWSLPQASMERPISAVLGGWRILPVVH